MLRRQMRPFSQSGRIMPQGRRIVLLLVLGIGIGLAGCQQSALMMSEAPPEPSTREKYPISVSPQQETLVLSPVLVGNSLGVADADKVTDFAGGYIQKGHGPLSIILPSLPNSPAITRQMEAINAILFERGVTSRQIEWRIATPAARSSDVPASGAVAPVKPVASATPPAALVFSYTRYTAAVGRECGDWEKGFDSNHDNHPWTNFGCAQQHNLAAMVSDPRDLEQPRPSTPIDVDRRTVVMKAYREGKKTTSERVEDERGILSDVAK